MELGAVLTQLDSLKRTYRQGRVSALVGAGFSQNACDKYPSWSQLLYDMAVELYQHDMDHAYREYKRTCPGSKLSHSAFIKREIPHVMTKVGYLSLVSRYIGQKGFREAIEYYIEERIPYIDTNDSMFRFAGKNSTKAIPVDKDRLSAHVTLLKGNWERVYTTNYDTLLEYAARLANLDYNVVTQAHQLSISSEATPTIIKLHGSLQDPSVPRRFEFDNNPHQQYIISEEDYTLYPNQHEAFTQLMRISLLQGVFCLVGFSGDDPNFVNWIRWVRDILVRDTENGRPKYKIFLLDISADMPTPDKQIYYDNHNILYVPLLNSEVKKHIGSTSKVIRDILSDFFNFLYHQDETDPNAYSSPWWDLEKREEKVGTNGYPIIRIDKMVVSKIITAKERNRIVFPDQSRRRILSALNWQDNLTPIEAQLGIIALRESGLPVSCFSSLGEKMGRALAGSSHADSYRETKDRSDTLNSFTLSFPQRSCSEYENLLRALFALDYRQAKVILDAWQPVGADMMKKAFFLSVFDDDAATRLLKEYLRNEPNLKEQYYATRLLRLIDRTFPPRYSTSKYSNYNIVDYMQIMDRLYHDVTDVDTKVSRYGDGSHEKVIHIGGSDNSGYEKSMAVLGFLIEAPAAVSHSGYVSLRKSSDWYAVFRNIFEQHPFASLFYSLQCTDDKVKTRIGQDYAYSNYISSTCLPLMLERLLKAYLSSDTPQYLKRSVLIISRELFVSVRPALWEPLFMTIWGKSVVPYVKKEENNPREELLAFAKKGLASMTSKKCRQRIIEDCLSMQQHNRDFVISCLYYLKPQKRDALGSTGLQDAVTNFVANVTHPLELTIAGNIHKLIMPKDMDVFRGKIRKMLVGKDVEDIVYRSASYFVKRGSPEEAAFVRSVCRNPRLWANGLHENGSYSSASEYLSLSSYSRNIHFDKAAVKSIYKKLKTSLKEIRGSRILNNDFYHFTNHDALLSEMVTFLNRHRSLLSKEQDFEEVYHAAINLFNRTRDYDNIEDGLLSVYRENVEGALDYIYMNWPVIEHDKLVAMIQLIANRLLFMHGDGLNACLAFLEFCLREKIVDKADSSVFETIGYILDKTTMEVIQRNGLDVVMACGNLCGIAKVMERNGIRSVGTQRWHTFAKDRRFYRNK